MSKAHDPHWRYIAFRITSQTKLSRRAIQNAITGRARHEKLPEAELPQLTRYEYPHAIIRVPHTRVSDARRLLQNLTWAIDAATKHTLQVETLLTSGTIKTLTTRLNILQQRGEPAPTTNNPRTASAPKGRHAHRKPSSLPRRNPPPASRRDPGPTDKSSP